MNSGTSDCQPIRSLESPTMAVYYVDDLINADCYFSKVPIRKIHLVVWKDIAYP